jgi:hypothetical protein
VTRISAPPGHRRALALAAATALAAALLVLTPSTSRAADATWTRVGTGILEGVSGAAANPQGGWVIVRDNKNSGQNRVALLSAGGTVTPLSWPGTAPADLEAIDGIPNQPGRFAVVTSAGVGRIIEVQGTTLRVVRSFRLPTGRTENEAFQMTRFGNTNVAVWGNRGSTSAPGRLYAAKFNVSTGAFGASVNATVRVSVPATNVRHISDAELVGGNQIVISSASDAGNNGPFSSSLHRVGTVSYVSGKARLSVTTPQLVATYDDHKIEAIACAGSSGIMGTDDENLGAFLAPATFC